MAWSYARPSDLGVVTSYYNPCGFRARAENFERFAEPIRAAGIPLVIVEACFGDETTTLPAAHASLRIQARDVLWHKERLLDLGTGWLPAHCTKVAWLDADILFENENGQSPRPSLLETSGSRSRSPKPCGVTRHAEPREGDDVFESFASVFVNRPEELTHGKFERHGHTGFAWAARRDLVARHGFYDACIAGSGDHMMAHAFAGDLESRCITRMVGTGGRHLAHYKRWGRKLHEELRAQLSFVPGRLRHLWHGTIENRRYAQRNKELIELAFDPKEDIRISNTGCWEWASDKPELHAWARRYFVERKKRGHRPERRGGQLARA